MLSKKIIEIENFIWIDIIDEKFFVYNQKIHRATNKSPFNAYFTQNNNFVNEKYVQEIKKKYNQKEKIIK